MHKYARMHTFFGLNTKAVGSAVCLEYSRGSMQQYMPMHTFRRRVTNTATSGDTHILKLLRNGIFSGTSRKFQRPDCSVAKVWWQNPLE